MSFDPRKFKLPLLFPHLQNFDLETKAILKKCSEAHRYLGQLKEASKNMPNAEVLIRTLALREAQQSSEIENIFTTQDRLYKNIVTQDVKDKNTKEVINYYDAIRKGFYDVQKTEVFTLNAIKKLHSIVKNVDEGFRIGEVMIATTGGDLIYLPPSDIDHMNQLLGELEHYINTPSAHAVDPLIKMAIIHYQFESIHPFTDGNGRVGRIINILYLVLQDILYTPVLYLSRYINEHKSQYYSGLRNISEAYNTEHEEKAWQSFIEYMLDALIETAKGDLQMVHDLVGLMQESKILFRDTWKLDFYSQDLIDHLFSYPYTRNSFTQKAMNISTPTAIRWLNTLVEKEYLEAHVLGRDKYYINKMLFTLLTKKTKS